MGDLGDLGGTLDVDDMFGETDADADKLIGFPTGVVIDDADVTDSEVHTFDFSARQDRSFPAADASGNGGAGLVGRVDNFIPFQESLRRASMDGASDRPRSSWESIAPLPGVPAHNARGFAGKGWVGAVDEVMKRKKRR